jgi:hypothetical protein
MADQDNHTLGVQPSFLGGIAVGMCLFFIFSFLVNTTKNQRLDRPKILFICSICCTLTSS